MAWNDAITCKLSLAIGIIAFYMNQSSSILNEHNELRLSSENNYDILGKKLLSK